MMGFLKHFGRSRALVEGRIAGLEQRQRLINDLMVRSFWATIDRLDAAQLPGRRLSCPVCDRTEAREALELRIDRCRFGGGRLERYGCPGCGCIYGPAKYLDLDPEFIRADYAMLYLDYAEETPPETELRAFRSLSPTRTGVYLDWGCGGAWNQTISTLRSQGYDVWGYEPSAQASRFVVSDRRQISAVFDGLFSNNVIEHLTRPLEEFRYFHRILKPGARMAHATACYRYVYTDTRFHVVFLLGDSPNVLAERSGFRVIAREEDGEFGNCVFERV